MKKESTSENVRQIYLKRILEADFEWKCDREALLIIIGAMYGCGEYKTKLIAQSMSDKKIAKEINMKLGFEAIDMQQIDAYDYLQFNREFATELNRFA